VLILGQWQFKPAAVAALCLWGMAYGAIPISLQTYMMRGYAAEGGLALFVTTSQLSLAAGSLIGGLVADNLGLATDYTLFALPAVIACRLSRHRPGRTRQKPRCTVSRPRQSEATVTINGADPCSPPAAQGFPGARPHRLQSR
jgi:predicted MFS family arabinose efflux permease